MGVLGGIIFWRLGEKKAAARDLVATQTKRKGMSPAVETTVAGPTQLDETVTGVGSIEASLVSNISSRVSLRINWIGVREGDRVRAGQVLVRLDPAELRTTLLQQQAALAEARARLAQAETTKNATSVEASTGVDQAQAALESARAEEAQFTRTVEATASAGRAQVADSDAKIAQAKLAESNARADLDAAKVTLVNAKAESDRNDRLLEKGFISQQVADNLRTKAQVQEGSVTTADGRVSVAKAAVTSSIAQRDAVKNQAAVANRKAVADLATSRAKRIQAEASLKLARANRAQPEAYQRNLAALAASVQATQALVDQAQGRLGETSLTSPIDGYVTKRVSDEGTVAAAGGTILEISKIDPVYVSVRVPVENAPRIGPGTQATLAFPNKTVQGVVTEVNPAADPESRQLLVRIRMANSSGALRPGMFARATLKAATLNIAVAVPTDAVRTGKKGTTITVIKDDGEAVTREVTLGKKLGDRVEVVSGVSAGEKVVTLTFSPVKDGQKVRDGSEKGGGGGPDGSKGERAGKKGEGGQAK
ncbi:MAG: efflux RND transporter periplasmic adaptor subunit [Armatimonas sp.]